MSLRCKLSGHDWADWGDMSYQEYLAHYPVTHCTRCNAKKNTKNGNVFYP